MNPLARSRPATRGDLAAIARVVTETEMFPGTMLDGMMATYLADPLGPERWLVHDEGEGAVAVAYYAPEPLTRGSFNLRCIAVLPAQQGRGIGTSLVDSVEAALREAGARVLLVETSGVPSFARTRSVYRVRGYAEAARLRDHYDVGDDKIVFRKDLRRPSARRADEPIEIRDATTDDLPRVVELARALGMQHQSYDPARFELDVFGQGATLDEAYARFFDGALAEAASVVRVAVCRGRVVGYVFARLEPESFLDLAAASGWIHDVFVEDEARGAGLGPRLVASALVALEARGMSRVRLTASTQNHHALATFAAMGFRTTLVEMQRDGAPPR